jgi:hypothetical protein
MRRSPWPLHMSPTQLHALKPLPQVYTPYPDASPASFGPKHKSRRMRRQFMCGSLRVLPVSAISYPTQGEAAHGPGSPLSNRPTHSAEHKGGAPVAACWASLKTRLPLLRPSPHPPQRCRPGPPSSAGDVRLDLRAEECVCVCDGVWGQSRRHESSELTLARDSPALYSMYGGGK